MEIIKIFGVILLILWAWIVFEFWRAPTYKEEGDGKYKLIQPTKKLSNLFKKRKK
jgi:hypothetical protein